MTFLDVVGSPILLQGPVDFSDDVLTLGDVVFEGYARPERLGAGGKQAMVVHKLPGGSRVIDTLGPDEDDIKWSGTFWHPNAFGKAMSVAAMRVAGVPVPLTFCGQFRIVVIGDFKWWARHMPNWIEYEVTCTVWSNPMLGILGAIPATINSLVGSDLGAAASIGGADSAAAGGGLSFPSGSLG